jgi:hypothetical protein
MSGGEQCRRGQSAPLKIEGAPIADLVATTTGTDEDFVVKLIDVYPPRYPLQPELGGYVQVLGERGIHARSAVSVAQVPFGACVEVDMIAEIEVRSSLASQPAGPFAHSSLS